MDKWLLKKPQKCMREQMEMPNSGVGDENHQLLEQQVAQKKGEKQKTRRRFLSKWLTEFKWAKYDFASDTCVLPASPVPSTHMASGNRLNVYSEHGKKAGLRSSSSNMTKATLIAEQ